MIYKIPFRFAVNSLLTLLSLVMIFHLLILTQVIPYNIVWGGNLQNTEQMIVFEIVSLLINTLIIITIAIKGKYLKFNLSQRLTDLLIWLFVILFSINTLGNLFAKASIETIAFTPMTFLSALFCFRIVLEDRNKR